ncbi:MAG: hypothetical protein ACRELC_04375 [Gemmatimonadota bacterium]
MKIPRPICARLAANAERELAAFFEGQGWGPSEGLRHIVDEWLVLRRLPGIEFRTGPLGRRAAVRGGPEVWEVVAASRAPGTREGVYAHFGWVDRARIEEALECYRLLPEPVDALIERNARLADAAADRVAGERSS